MSLAWLKGNLWLGTFGKLSAASVLAASFGSAGCGDDPVKSPLAEGCTLNSDCNGGLVCSFGLCHQECEQSKDCPANQRCVQTEGTNVCQLDKESQCHFNTDCAEPLVCAIDLQCRNQCQEKRDCLGGQECVESVCAEPEEVTEDGSSLKGAVDGSGGAGGGGNGAGGEAGSPPTPTCTPGGECVPDDLPCQVGVIECQDGKEVCAASRAADDGTECGDDKVCGDGECVACVAGDACQPDANNDCVTGTISCALGPVCESAGNADNGTECGADQVCSSGTCVACVVGEACDPVGQPCKEGKLACANGPVCNATTSKGAGTTCGTDKVCDSGGACQACVQNGPCEPEGNECHLGTQDCTNGPNCTDSGLSAPDGTVCTGFATYNFCAGGYCEACQNSNPCIPENPCHKGTLNCGTTPPTCNDTQANADDGIVCGDNKSCISGDCVDNDRTLTITSAEPGDVPIDAPFATVSVKLVDKDNVPVSGTAITVLPSAGAYAQASNTSGSGVSQISGRVGRAVGTHTFTVSAPGASSVQFSVDAIEPTTDHIFTLVNVNHLSGVSTAPGPGTISKLYYDAAAITSAKDGTLYLASYCAVYKLSTEGVLTRVAGSPNESCGSTGDSGIATSALVYNVSGLAIDEANEYLYLADYSNYRVRQIDLSTTRPSGGKIFTLAGGGGSNVEPWGDNGPADGAYVLPSGVAVAPNGDIYISDHNSNHIRKVDFDNGVISTVIADAPCTTNGPLVLYDCGANGDACSMAWNEDGALFISGYLCGGGHSYFRGIARVEADNSLTHIAGTDGPANDAEGGAATSATFAYSPAIAFDKVGNLYLSAYGEHRVRRIDAATAHITTLAGNGTAAYVGDYVLGTSAQLNYPTGLAFDDAGNLYFADGSNYAIRGLWNVGKTSASTAKLATVSGGGQTVKVDAPFSPLTVKLTDGDDAAIQGVGVRWKRLETGSGLGASGAISTTSNTLASGNSSMTGRVGLATGNYTFEASYTDIHGKPASGSPQTFTVAAAAPDAGTIFPIVNYVHTSGNTGVPGPATYAKLESYALGTAVAADGTMYVSDYCRILKITPRGEASLLAGSTCGFSGDSGPALGAKLYGVFSLALDEVNQVLYAADWYNQRIRAITLSTNPPSIDTLAGGGTVNAEPFGDGGDAREANIGYVSNVSVGPDGLVYLSDYYHGRIRVVDPDTGFIEAWLPDNTTCTQGVVSFRSVDDYSTVVRFDENGDPYVSGYICPGVNTNYTLGIVKRTGTTTFTHIAGLYNGGTTEGADATATEFGDFGDFIFDANQNIVLTTWSLDTVRRINMSTGKINTIAGDGTAGYSSPSSTGTPPGDYEPATTARFTRPWKLALLPGGHLLVSDEDNTAMRLIW